MSEIEPTIENVQPGDVVTIETGTPGVPGHESDTYRATSGIGDVGVGKSLDRLRALTRMGYRITRIARPAPPIPTIVGERFWARYEGADYVEEFVVTRRNGETLFVSLHDGLAWTPEEHGESFTVVPGPEPKPEPGTVPVPARLIQEAKDRIDEGSVLGAGSAWAVVRDIVRAVREREGESCQP